MDEEQEMELEALEAIYMDELDIISSTAPRSFKLRLQPEGVMDEETTTMAVIMKVTLPESYPDELPELELTPEMGVTESECESLTNELLSLAEENLGIQMIFMLASHVQEWMIDTQKQEEESKNTPSVEEIAAATKRHGTPVTRENFLEWKENFDAEMAQKYKVNVSEDLGLTGRQLFEKDASLFDGDRDDIYVEDESLFADDDGVDF